MFRFRHKTLIIFSGAIWFSIGLWLLSLGLRFLLGSVQGTVHPLPLLNFLSPLAGGFENAAMLLVAVALAIGFFKGKYVLAKSAKRIISRISSLPEPAPLRKVYAPSYFLLLGTMVLIGVAIKVFEVPTDVRGLVDTAIGAALINGSMFYFKR